MVVAAASCVATDGAIADLDCCSAGGNAAAREEGEIISDCAAGNCECSVKARNAAAAPIGRVTAHSAVDDDQRPRSVIDSAAIASVGTVVGHGTIVHGQRCLIVVHAPSTVANS